MSEGSVAAGVRRVEALTGEKAISVINEQLAINNQLKEILRNQDLIKSVETLIAENIDSADQGKVYGSHFAFSHLWWAIAYPIAGLLGTSFPNSDFLFGGLLTIILSIAAVIIFKPSFHSFINSSTNK